MECSIDVTFEQIAIYATLGISVLGLAYAVFLR